MQENRITGFADAQVACKSPTTLRWPTRDFSLIPIDFNICGDQIPSFFRFEHTAMPLQGKYEVKLGRSFLDPSQNCFMTMRCDFLPASVDREQPGSIKIVNEKEVDVRLPNVPGAEQSSTLLKGNIRPVQKECLLIYNKTTGELTLERISKAAQLKNVRDGPPSKRPSDSTQNSLPLQSAIAPNQPSKPKVRTMSESSSESSVRLPKPKRTSPPDQRPPPSSNLKLSTLSSSSSSSSSSISESGILTNSPQKQRHRQPSSLSSLSELDDKPTTAPPPATQQQSISKGPTTSQPSTSMQRALMANYLHLSESESEEDDEESS
ncbi:ell associated factor 1 [Echinococcus multilocularis]|uniref:Ell associated factor 1 n=1 Tax=Echinococcus multilocularis TaxID=6211 RepID=A0A087VZF1_ECHMU|nr:ell associated factor 1 [Echinococcus multilocularis]